MIAMKSFQKHFSQLLQTVPVSKMLQLTLCIDAFFEQFKTKSKMSVKKLHYTAPIHLLKRPNIMEILPNPLVR